MSAAGAADSSDLLITYTIFPSVWPREKTERADTPWRELVAKIRDAPTYIDKAHCPLVSLCAYGGLLSASKDNPILRHAANVERCYGIELDYDGEELPIERGAQRLQAAGLLSVLYTSPSYRAEKPRWRAIFPFSEPALPEKRSEYVGRANRVLGGVASRESFTLSQSFYIGRVRGVEYVVLETAGRCLDLAADLEPLYYAGYEANGERVRDETTDADLRATFERGENRYTAMLKLSSRWAARGMGVDDIENSLHALLGAGTVNADGIDLRTRCRPLAESAVRKFGETRPATRQANGEGRAEALPRIDAQVKESAVASARKPPDSGGEPPAPDPDDPGPEPPAVEVGLSDDELALRFTARYKDELRYVAAWDRWLLWDGCRWAHDEKRSVFDLSRRICREALAEYLPETMTESAYKTLRKRLGDAKTVYNVIKLAGADPRHAVAVAELDADPWKLNTPAGVFDLRSGLMAPHDPAGLHTKVTAAAPGGECPVFLKTLIEALPSEEVRSYVQRLFGYGMTGSSRDHALSFWWGSGRNGKGTIAHAFRRALGDYGLEVGAELFMESHHERHPTEIAVLRGARFVVASEIDTGRRWNEARLKRLTGGDPISARYIGKDLFEFEPTHTLLIIGNTKPGLRSVDEAMRARMQLVEFGVTVAADKRDTSLSEKLEAEYGGILAWALAGCMTWQRDGLKPPASVLAATAGYLDAEDSIAQWISETCERTGELKLSAGHRSYREWCDKNAAPALGRNSFADQLESHGYKRGMDDRGKSVVFLGISLPIPKDYMQRAEDEADERRERDARFRGMQ